MGVGVVYVGGEVGYAVGSSVGIGVGKIVGRGEGLYVGREVGDRVGSEVIGSHIHGSWGPSPPSYVQ